MFWFRILFVFGENHNQSISKTSIPYGGSGGWVGDVFFMFLAIPRPLGKCPHSIRASSLQDFLLC